MFRGTIGVQQATCHVGQTDKVICRSFRICHACLLFVFCYYKTSFSFTIYLVKEQTRRGEKVGDGAAGKGGREAGEEGIESGGRGRGPWHGLKELWVRKILVLLSAPS